MFSSSLNVGANTITRLMVASLNKTIAKHIKATQTKRPQIGVLSETKISVCRCSEQLRDNLRERAQFWDCIGRYEYMKV